MPATLHVEVEKLRAWLAPNRWIGEYGGWWSVDGVVNALRQFLARAQPQEWSEGDVADLLFVLENATSADAHHVAELLMQSEPMALAITKHAFAAGGVGSARLVEYQRYCQKRRDDAELLSKNMVRIDANLIVDHGTFHRVFAEAFGFPAYYGHNMNAWIDCLGYLDVPSGGMCSVQVTPGQTLALVIDDASSFRERCPAVFEAFVECLAVVNWRRVEDNRPPLITLAMHL